MQNFPLNDSQKAVWAYCKKYQQLPVYQICVEFGAFENVNIEKLTAAAKATIKNHQLFSAIVTKNESNLPYFQIFAHEPQIDYIEVDNQQLELQKEEFCKPFEIENSLLYRISIVKNSNKYYLWANFHHIIFDGFSTNIFISDVIDYYNDRPLKPEKISFSDLTKNELNAKHNSDFQTAELWYKTNFPPFSCKTLPIPEFNSKEVYPKVFNYTTTISTDDFLQNCKKLNQPATAISCVAFGITATIFTDENEAHFSTVFHGRHSKSQFQTVGMIVKTLPIAILLSEQKSIKDLIIATKRQLAKNMVNDIYPFSEICKYSGNYGDLNFIYQGNTEQEILIGKQKLKWKFLSPGFTGATLSLELWTNGNNLKITAEYNSAKYSEQLVFNFCETFAECLKSIFSANYVSEINAISPKMKNMIFDFNHNIQPQNIKNVIEEFELIAQKYPNHLAIKTTDNQLTYKELDIITNKIALYLKSCNIQKGNIVGVFTERNQYIVILPIAILKTGAAFFPCTYENSTQIINNQCNELKINLLIAETSNNLKTEINCKTITINEIIENSQNLNGELNTKYNDEDLFALFLTSGTMGNTKAVKISHKNIAAYCDWYHDYFQPTEKTTIGAYNNFGFDAYLTDVFTAITSGATVAIVPQNAKKDLKILTDFIEKNNVQIIDLPTQIGQIFVSTQKCNCLKHIVLGGETVVPFNNCNNYSVYNQYGPTETTIAVTIHKISENEHEIPLGKCLKHAKIYILDSNQNPKPVGALGEIAIAGCQVSQGYYNNEKLTNEKFIKNNFDQNTDYQTLYLTGDYGRIGTDGNLYFCGRKDSMLKINGYRLNINELETIIRKIENVSQAAVIVETVNNYPQIKVYVSGNNLNIKQLKNELTKLLPVGTIPNNIIKLDNLPKTPHGKIDKNQLKNLETANNYAPPQNETERIICETFETILNTKNIGTNSDFFELGGNSISAMYAVVALNNQNLNVKYGDIYDCRTPQKLAQQLNNDIIKSTINQSIRIKLKNNDCLENSQTQKVETVILTGATGYLGAHILNELVNIKISKIYCVTRSKNNLTATQRLKSILTYYFDEKTESIINSVTIIDGDICNEDIWQKLKNLKLQNCIFVNCAAVVKYFDQTSALENINVKFVEKLSQFCIKNNYELVQISTLSAVAGKNVDETQFCDLSQDSTPYTISKWKAEQILFNNVKNGLKLKLIRVGNLAPRIFDGKFQINYYENAFYNLLKIIDKTKYFPKTLQNCRIDYTPVDLAAKAVSKLLTLNHFPTIFHVFNPELIDVKNLIKSDEIEICDDVEFVKLASNLSPQYSTIMFATKDYINNFSWNNRFTNKILGRLNFRWQQ